MANQPKKYKKFVATAATATLVASAIVPVASAASFSDVADTNSHAEAINALVEAGIIKGYEDGTFKPNATLTRGHVVKMLGKWVETQGFEIPADYDKVARFTDLAVDAADQELVKYAALVKDTGVFNGLADGSLNAKGDITRENMALTLDRAYKAVFGKTLVELAEGVEDLTVTDLATAKAEAREAIQALRDLEISNVDTFNPKDTVKRGQFASFLHRTINVADAAAKLKVESVTAVNGTLTVKLAEKAETVEVKNFTVTQAINGGEAKEVTPSKAELAEDGLTVTLTVPEVAVDATADQSVVYTVNKVAAPAFVVAATPKVESLNAINLKQVEIKFNQELDKDAALDVDNYEVAGTNSIAKLQLSEDKKTVTLTLTDALANQTGEVTVTVLKGMEFASGKTLAADVKVEKIKYTDTTLPKIDEVQVVGNKQLVVKFSEPVKNSATVLSNYTIDGKTFGAYTPKLDADTQRELTIDLTTALKAGDHTFKIAANKVADLVDLKNVEQEVTVNVEDVTTAPTATIVTEKTMNNKVAFKFDRKVKTTPKVKFNGVSATKVEADEKDETGTTYIATFTSIPNAGGDIRIEKGIEDFYGNKTTEDIVLSFKPVIDSEAPQFVSAVVEKDGEIVVKYDEDIIISGAKIKLVDKDNKEVKTSFDYNKDSKNKVLKKELKITGNISTGDYKLSITGVKDESGNIAKELKDHAITVADKVAPTVTSSYKKDGSVYVTFSEKVANADTLENYQYNLAGVGSLDLPEGTKVTALTDGKSVKIELPKSWKYNNVTKTIDDVTALTIKNIEDLSGNKLAQVTKTFEAAPNVAGVKSVTAVNSKTVEVQLNESGLLPIDAVGSDFIVKAGDVTLAVAQAEVNTKDRKIVLTLAEELRGDAKYQDQSKAFQNVTVETVTDVVVTKTADGQAFDLNATEIGDGIRLQVKDIVAGDSDTADNETENHIFTVTFSEPVKDANNNSNVADEIQAALKVLGTNATGEILLGADAYTAVAVGNDNTTFEVKLTDKGIASLTADTLTVAFDTGSLTDVAGLTLLGSSKAVDVKATNYEFKNKVESLNNDITYKDGVYEIKLTDLANGGVNILDLVTVNIAGEDKSLKELTTSTSPFMKNTLATFSSDTSSIKIEEMGSTAPDKSYHFRNGYILGEGSNSAAIWGTKDSGDSNFTENDTFSLKLTAGNAETTLKFKITSLN